MKQNLISKKKLHISLIPDLDRSQVLFLTELLASRQPLFQSFNILLSHILKVLDASVVQYRTKALRALGQIVLNNPKILNQVNVRKIITLRLQDNSSQVRDAAIELVGKYLTQKPEITEHYFSVISERILVIMFLYFCYSYGHIFNLFSYLEI